jgi:hypothetical protein
MMPPLCSILEDISNIIEDDEVPSIVAFSTSSLIPIHKQLLVDESPSIPTRKRPLSLSPAVKSTKKVTFGSNYSFEIPSKADMTADEIESTWWSRREFTSIKHECIVTIERMLMYDSIDLSLGSNTDEYCCPRGLEVHCCSPKQQRHKLSSAIFEEQRYQYEHMGFIWDLEKLASKYEMFSAKSARQAHRMGLEDQLAASQQMLE